ncbi:unnamed protein product [Nezara viridula]|uniref:Uncharacterized protein n=1 Tax=Nezara viridula TaxID=85310 RepID=A0A9P0HP96_NEZVI|nr:unnamed protein product [Nezara viridula]
MGTPRAKRLLPKRADAVSLNPRGPNLSAEKPDEAGVPFNLGCIQLCLPITQIKATQLLPLCYLSMLEQRRVLDVTFPLGNEGRKPRGEILRLTTAAPRSPGASITTGTWSRQLESRFSCLHLRAIWEEKLIPHLLKHLPPPFAVIFLAHLKIRHCLRPSSSL